jgi:N-acetyl-S-(2-succino)cysteine monooxygenase
VQAGSSEPGKALAARTAELVFTAQQSFESARAFYSDVKARMPAFGRDPDTLKIMPGIFPVVGATEAEARAKYDVLGDLVHPSMPQRFLADLFRMPELLDYPVDEPVPASISVDNRESRPALILDIGRRDKLTVRQLYLRFAAARGHSMIFGSPEQIADKLEEWFDGEAADGFNIMPPYVPGGLSEFAEQVVPILQQRGRFRTDYEGRTLRENLGLPFPTHAACRANRAVADA